MKSQKLQNFQLSDKDKTINIKYQGCYETYLMDYFFTNNLEYVFGIQVNTFGNKYDYISLGFINEYFNIYKDCFCCHPNNSVYIRIDEEAIYSNQNRFTTKLDNKTNFTLRFILDLN